MNRDPHRPTYLESLDEAKRTALLDMANLLRQDRHRLQSGLPRANDSPLRTARPLDSQTLYMKSIWQLRHQLNALTVDHDATRERLLESERRCRELESELERARAQYSRQMATMADQVEELISRSDLASRSAHVALRRQQRTEDDRHQTEAKLSTLRSLLASDFARNNGGGGRRQEAARQARLLETLITPDLLLASQPPAEFVGEPGPRPCTTQEFRSLETAVKQAQADRQQLRHQLDDLQAKHERALRDHQERTRASDEQKAKLTQSLTGAARRIQWLVGEKQKLANSFRSLNDYSTKLERKLLDQYEELQRLKAPKKAKVVSAPPSKRKSESAASSSRQGRDDDSKAAADTTASERPLDPVTTRSAATVTTKSAATVTTRSAASPTGDNPPKSIDDSWPPPSSVPIGAQPMALAPVSSHDDDDHRPSLSELVRAAVDAATDDD